MDDAVTPVADGAEPAAQEWRRHWAVPLVSAVGLAVGAIYLYSIGLFMEPLRAEFGWSRTQITLGLSIVSVLTVVASPFMGMVIDRFGARRIALPGMAIYCAAIALLSLVGGEIWMWWAAWLGVAVGSLCIKPTVWATAVSGHFSSGRGLAIGIALCGTGFGQAILPTITNALIEQHGWRFAYAVLGLGSAAVVLPLMAAFFRDAQWGGGRVAGASRLADAPGVGLREGYMSKQFLFLLATALLATSGVVGIVVHFVPLLVAAGIDSKGAAVAAGAIGLTSMAGRILSGYLMDRWNGRWIGACTYLLPCVPCYLLVHFEGTQLQATGIAVLIGLSLGAEIDVLAYLSSRYFGLRHYGALFGTIVGALTLGAGVGPLLMGTAFDISGHYAPALWAFLPIFPVTGGLIAALGPFPDFRPKGSVGQGALDQVPEGR